VSVEQDVGLTMSAGTSRDRVEAPAEESLNLYRFPALYDSLKTPDAEDLAAVRSLLRRFVGDSPWSIVDPACGPGNWLRPFREEARLLAGNDNCREMVDYTRETTGALVTLGDMFELRFEHVFDVVLEASGVTSLLPDIDTVQRWVLSFRHLLSARGVVLLLMNFKSPVPAKLPATLWRTPWRNVPGGEARIEYELLRDSKELGSQHIRRTVETRGGDWPRKIVESYDLRVWNPAHLETLRQIPGYELAACVDAAHPDNLSAQPKGERLLVFRPV
jgi:SAM-dependent methyltransferase